MTTSSDKNFIKITTFPFLRCQSNSCNVINSLLHFRPQNTFSYFWSTHQGKWRGPWYLPRPNSVFLLSYVLPYHARRHWCAFFCRRPEGRLRASQKGHDCHSPRTHNQRRTTLRIPCNMEVKDFPADTRRDNNVVMTSNRRHDVVWRHNDVIILPIRRQAII